MIRRPSRRRFLAISAAAVAAGASGASTPTPQTRWRGTALGAGASITIAGLDRVAARPVIAAVEAELIRLEEIFSLYRPDSALSRLNAAGRLAAPPPELLQVLSLADRLHHGTAGAFDPTVQPLFDAYANAAAKDRTPDPEALEQARGRVGWDAVRFDPDAVRLCCPGAALTLNGIAQGYITDKVAALLKSRGLRDVLVDAGEIAALGRRPDGAPWRAGIASPDGRLLQRLTLSDRALATSAPKGTVLDPRGQLGHIFDPVVGSEARGATLVSVSAPTAALADGLSTALCVAPAHLHRDIVNAFPGTTLEVII